MGEIIESFFASHPVDPAARSKLILTVSLIALVILLQRLVVSVVWRRTDDPRTRYRWRKNSSYLSVLACFLLVGFIWFETLRTFATFLGLVSAGLAIALKDLVANVAGWLFIIWRRPLEVGDRIELGRYRGDVIDIRIFEFSIMEIGNWVDADQSTGRVVHIPNGHVLSAPLANYAKGFQFIWNEIPVTITFDSNWRRAKEILQNIADKNSLIMSDHARETIKESARRYLIVYRKLTPTVYTKVEPSGVMLTIRYLTNPRQRRGTEEAMWENILHEFGRAEDIAFAYPTGTVHVVDKPARLYCSDPDCAEESAPEADRTADRPGAAPPVAPSSAGAPGPSAQSRGDAPPPPAGPREDATAGEVLTDNKDE